VVGELLAADGLDLDGLMAPLKQGMSREVWNSSTYWEAQGMEFREMGPDEPIPPPNVITHWVQDGVAYWVVGSPGPTPYAAAIASRDIFRRKLRAAGVAPGRAAKQSADLWRHVERAARPARIRAAARSQARQVEQTIAREARPSAQRITQNAAHVRLGLADRKRARLAAEVREAKARAARRAAARVSPSARKKEEGRRRDHQQRA
jgi:hypothetical protein